MSAESDFARLVEALRPYLEDLVFVGGWAHRLHALHELAGPVDFAPLLTLDADITPARSLYLRTENLRECLLKAGFVEELRGEDSPPQARYHSRKERSSLFAEFLTPQTGSGYRRSGKRGDTVRDDTVRIGGITAQKLRHVELLLIEPWSVRLSRENGFPLAEPREVRIANPVTFVLQKVLISARRRPESQPKDILYVHDTLLRFAPSLQALRECRERIRPALPPGTPDGFQQRRRALFSEVNDLLRRAALLAHETGRRSPPTAERIAQVCRLGLTEVFGPA